MAKINWLILKNEYITDPTTSLEKLAIKYGVSDTAVKEKSANESWAELRKQSLQKISDKLTEKTTDTIASFQADKLKAGKYMIGVGLTGIKTHAPRNARESREIIDSGYKIATEAMGLNDPKVLIQNNQNINYISLNDFVKNIDKRIEEDQ